MSGKGKIFVARPHCQFSASAKLHPAISTIPDGIVTGGHSSAYLSYPTFWELLFCYSGSIPTPIAFPPLFPDYSTAPTLKPRFTTPHSPNNTTPPTSTTLLIDTTPTHNTNTQHQHTTPTHNTNTNTQHLGQQQCGL
jgi:hypothetical protein